MFSFRSKITKTDVTSLKILHNFVFAGIGDHMNVYDNESQVLIKRIQIFNGIRIHGIQISHDEKSIILHGRDYLTVCDLKLRLDGCIYRFSSLEKKNLAVCGSWILGAKWIEGSTRIATVSVHNKLQIWSVDLKLLHEVFCEERCLLYSAYLCFDSWTDLIVLSGTIFSEILIWKPSECSNNEQCIVKKRLKAHKGVIFSVHYNETSNFICSSSDDRSAVLWDIPGKNLLEVLKKPDNQIKPRCTVYGHLSRVFRCKVLNDHFITAGEDSVINLWNFDGTLSRKFETQPCSSVWAVDCDELNKQLVVGGGDSGLVVFPYSQKNRDVNLTLPDSAIPKRVALLASDNIVTVTDKGVLYMYARIVEKWLHIDSHDDMGSYTLLDVTKCRKLVSLSGYSGQIYIYKEDNSNLDLLHRYVTEEKSRILALHWLNCKLFLTCHSEGKVFLHEINPDKINTVCKFILPPSKERWATSACLGPTSTVILGDRKGNIHIFRIGQEAPVQTLKKAHSHLGVTHVCCENNKLISLGRNSMIKTYYFHPETGFSLMSSDKTPITWLASKVDEILVAFSGDQLVLWNSKTRRTILQYNCGGGHRSFDFKKTSESIVFIHIKDKLVKMLIGDWKNIFPKELEESYHVNEINALEVLDFGNDKIVITGGEDTTLRISLINFRDRYNFKTLYNLKSHLSNIRALFVLKLLDEDNSFLVFSGGGRAQIILWYLKVHVKDDKVNNVLCSEHFIYHEELEKEESEMRVMDLNATLIGSEIILFAACSDGNIKIFYVVKSNRLYKMNFCKNIFYKMKCILKIVPIVWRDLNILVTMSTDGFLVFWNIDKLLYDSESPLKTFKVHQSGINTCSLVFKDNSCFILTGGDDNAIVLSCISIQRFHNDINIEDVCSFKDVGTHCTQITGAFICDNYFITTANDQRVAAFSWECTNKSFVCKLLSIYRSPIDDVQGMQCVRSVHGFEVFLHGQGLDFVKIQKSIC